MLVFDLETYIILYNININNAEKTCGKQENSIKDAYIESAERIKALTL